MVRAMAAKLLGGAAGVLGLATGVAFGMVNGLLAGMTTIPTFIVTLATMKIAESLGMVIRTGTIQITQRPSRATLRSMVAQFRPLRGAAGAVRGRASRCSLTVPGAVVGEGVVVILPPPEPGSDAPGRAGSGSPRSSA